MPCTSCTSTDGWNTPAEGAGASMSQASAAFSSSTSASVTTYSQAAPSAPKCSPLVPSSGGVPHGCSAAAIAGYASDCCTYGWVPWNRWGWHRRSSRLTSAPVDHTRKIKMHTLRGTTDTRDESTRTRRECRNRYGVPH